MSDPGQENIGKLVAAARRDLAPLAGANGLVARGLADLVQIPQPTTKEDISKNAHFYYDRGWQAYKNRDYSKAIECFTEAIGSNPNWSWACFWLRGLTRCQTEEYDKAIKDFDEALKLNNIVTDAIRRGVNSYDVEDRHATICLVYRHRGQAWAAKKEYDKAIDDLNDASRADPKDAFTYKARAEVWALKKNYDKAIEDYTLATELNPKVAPAEGVRHLLPPSVQAKLEQLKQNRLKRATLRSSLAERESNDSIKQVLKDPTKGARGDNATLDAPPA